MVLKATITNGLCLILKVNTYLTWSNFRSVIAKFLSFVILFVGALSSATGGFKAIPILLSFYPLNLVTWPSALITFFCCASGLSGFFSFYGGYEEAVSSACYRFVDYIKNKITTLFIKSSEQSASLDHDQKTICDPKLIEKKEELAIIANTNKKAHRKLSEDTGTLEKYKIFLHKPITDENFFDKYKSYFNGNTENKTYYTLYKDLLNTIESTINSSETKKSISSAFSLLIESTLKSNHNKFTDLFYKAYNIFIQILSFALVSFGCIVVIGMGVITNQGFITYWGLNQTTLALLTCFLAATLKQICQMAFNASKHHAIFCSLFGVSLTKKQPLDQEVEQIEQRIKTQMVIKDVLEQIKEDIHVIPGIQEIKNVKRLLLTNASFKISHHTDHTAIVINSTQLNSTPPKPEP